MLMIQNILLKLVNILLLLQARLTRDERRMAATINMTYDRPDQFKPTCGTSDPGIMQVSSPFCEN